MTGILYFLSLFAGGWRGDEAGFAAVFRVMIPHAGDVCGPLER
jgi:hypothetical protein